MFVSKHAVVRCIDNTMPPQGLDLEKDPWLEKDRYYTIDELFIFTNGQVCVRLKELEAPVMLGAFALDRFAVYIMKYELN